MQLVTRPTVQMCAVKMSQLARKSVLPEADLMLLGDGMETRPTIRSMAAVTVPVEMFACEPDPFPMDSEFPIELTDSDIPASERQMILEEWIISE